MQTAHYTFLGTAQWVTESIKRELAERFSVQVEVKKQKGGVGGSLSVKTDDEDALQKARAFIESNALFKNHFTPAA